MQSNFQAGCSTIASAITAQGVSTASNASPSTMANNISTLATNKYNSGYNAIISASGLVQAEARSFWANGGTITLSSGVTLGYLTLIITRDSDAVGIGGCSISSGAITTIATGAHSDTPSYSRMAIFKIDNAPSGAIIYVTGSMMLAGGYSIIKIY
jgi:hypothetical protein